ncbi:ATP-binding protein [Streptosporangium sp. NPDC087985]|uniref:ATP-binding protein n=1 Tax=Streptosporangium sp. NPDC087985 TaxID=3366196 RepID=UPI00382F1421
MTLHHNSPAVFDSAPEYAAERLLPAVPTSVREARSMVRRELSLWGADDLIDDCVLVVSELVTNAVRHGGAACALRIRGNERQVYGELFDPGVGAPTMCKAGTEATGGRGLQIVDTLVDDWGVTWPAAGGKAVWFVLALPAPHRCRSLSPVLEFR